MILTSEHKIYEYDDSVDSIEYIGEVSKNSQSFYDKVLQERKCMVFNNSDGIFSFYLYSIINGGTDVKSCENIKIDGELVEAWFDAGHLVYYELSDSNLFFSVYNVSTKQKVVDKKLASLQGYHSNDKIEKVYDDFSNTIIRYSDGNLYRSSSDDVRFIFSDEELAIYLFDTPETQLNNIDKDYGIQHGKIFYSTKNDPRGRRIWVTIKCKLLSKDDNQN